MAKPATFLTLGATSTYLYNNSDIVEEFMKDGTRGMIHSLTGPRANPTPAKDMRQLQSMVTSLSAQIDALAASQRTSQQIIVATSQPSTILGIPTWKLVGLVGTAGVIYFKIKGYELRDLVYVSKRHFTNVAEALKKQYEALDQTVRAAREDLMRRIGLVETKVDQAQKSIELKIDTELGKVSGQIEEVSFTVSKLDASLFETNAGIKNVGADVMHVKSELNRVADGIDRRLERMHVEVEDFKDASSQGQREMKHEMGKIDSKLDGLSRSTHATLNSLQVGLDRQSRGIGLLCEFVRNTAQPTNAPSVDGSRRWLDELNMFTRETRSLSSSSSDSPTQQPQLMKKRSSGLIGLKAIAAN